MPDYRLLLREAKPLRRQPVLIHDAGVQRGGGAWVVVVIFFIVLRTSALATFRRLFVIVFPVFVIVFTAFLAVFVRLLPSTTRLRYTSFPPCTPVLRTKP